MTIKKKNYDEYIAGEFLKSINIGDIEHEPDGNVTPDFLINNKTAVEVTRLSQHYFLPGGKVESIEGIGAGAWKAMKDVLNAMGASIGGESWHVCMTFQRPLRWKTLKPELVSQLKYFKNSCPRNEITINIGGMLIIHISRARKDTGYFFNLLGSGNLDVGGSVLALVEENLRFCVAQKEKKVEKYRYKYNEWWLVLINRIDLYMEAGDYENFGAKLNPPLVHGFQKIILVDNRDWNVWFEV